MSPWSGFLDLTLGISKAKKRVWRRIHSIEIFSSAVNLPKNFWNSSEDLPISRDTPLTVCATRLEPGAPQRLEYEFSPQLSLHPPNLQLIVLLFTLQLQQMLCASFRTPPRLSHPVPQAHSALIRPSIAFTIPDDVSSRYVNHADTHYPRSDQAGSNRVSFQLGL